MCLLGLVVNVAKAAQVCLLEDVLDLLINLAIELLIIRFQLLDLLLDFVKVSRSEFGITKKLHGASGLLHVMPVFSLFLIIDLPNERHIHRLVPQIYALVPQGVHDFYLDAVLDFELRCRCLVDVDTDRVRKLFKVMARRQQGPLNNIKIDLAGKGVLSKIRVNLLLADCLFEAWISSFGIVFEHGGAHQHFLYTEREVIVLHPIQSNIQFHLQNLAKAHILRLPEHFECNLHRRH